MNYKLSMHSSVIMLLIVCAAFSEINPEMIQAADKSEVIQTLPIKQLEQKKWQQDFAHLLIQINKYHPKPWRSISEKQFKNQLKVIANDVNTTSQEHTILKLINTFSAISGQGFDAHTQINPFQEATHLKLLPIRMYWFEDGIYIVDSNRINRELIGHKVKSIDGISIEDVIKKAEGYLSNESPSWFKNWILFYASIHELLELEKISKRQVVDIITQTPEGLEKNTSLSILSIKAYKKQFPLAIERAGLPTRDESSTYLKKASEDYFKLEKISAQTLYAKFNLDQHSISDESLFTHFANDVEITIKQHQLHNLIIDIRNYSAEEDTYGSFVDMLNQFKLGQYALDIYVILDRGTFSKGVSFAIDLQLKTDAIFIGEATGGSPNHYGAPKVIYLKNSKLSVTLSTRLWIKDPIDTKKLSFYPDFPVKLTSSSYFSGKDTSLDKVLELIEIKSFD